MPSSGYLERHDYRVDLLARRNRITVRAGDRVIAQSARSILVDEQDHGLVFYLPEADLVAGALVSVADKTSVCPYKGEAIYLALADAPETPVAWRYDRPLPQVAAIAGHVAFYQDRVALTVGAD
jgi:uncharacterized protein (DUF427 family)